MPQFQIKREVELPDVLEVRSIYFIAPLESEFCEIHVVGNTVETVRRVPTITDILCATIPTDQAFSGHRAVRVGSDGMLELASSTGSPAIGFLRDAVDSGDDAAMFLTGTINGFLGLIPNTIYYLGTNGAITATVPTSGWLQELGTATATDTLALKISDPIQIL